MREEKMTWSELLVIVGVVLAFTVLLIPSCRSVRHARERSSCALNLRKMGVVFKMYAAEWGGMFPRVHGDQPWGGVLPTSCMGTDTDAHLAPRIEAIYPKYLSDLNALVCPSFAETREDDPLQIVRDVPGQKCPYGGTPARPDLSYIYLGFVIDKASDSDPTVDASFVGGPSVPMSSQAAYLASCLFIRPGMSLATGPLGDKNPDNDCILDHDIDDAAKASMISSHSMPPGQPLGNFGEGKILRIKEGVEVFLMTDINGPASSARWQAMIPVMWDVISTGGSSGTQFSHAPLGVNTLYMDGHSEFHRYPGVFPASKAFSDTAGLWTAR